MSILRKFSLIAFVVLMTNGIVFAAPAVQNGEKKKVAVLNFTNNTGSKGLDYLSTALADSVSSTLSQKKSFQLIERSQLGAILNQIEVEQTGLFDAEQLTETGKLAKAEILIIGNYSGSAGKLYVTVKAVETNSAKILESRSVAEPLDRIFDGTSQIALVISSVLSGEKLGSLTVSSNPDGCDVYIDGMLAGKSPLIEYKLPSGAHKVRVTRSNYIDNETNVTIRDGDNTEWNPTLARKELMNRFNLGFSVFYMLPMEDGLQGGPYFAIHIGQAYQYIMLGAELGYSRINADQNLSSPFGTINKEGWFNYFNILGSIMAVPFPTWSYFSPYAGPYIGYVRFSELHKVADENVKVGDGSNLFLLGGKVGVNLLQFAKVTVFIEGRYFYTWKESTRNVYTMPGLSGGLQTTLEDFNLNGWVLGGGLNINF